MLSNQWGESRQNSEVLAAIVQAAGLDLDSPLGNSDLMSWELGQLDFHNRFRFIYDDVNTELKVQRNTGTEAVPNWVTALTIDYETSLLTTTGDTRGFYLGLNRVELFGLNKIQPDSFYNVKTLYFSSDDGFYFTTGPNGNPVVRLSDRVSGGGTGAGISSVAVRSTVSSPTYNTDTIIFDKDDFYISPSSSGKPIISLNSEGTSSGISSIAVRSTVSSPTFNTDTVIFDKDDFYLSPNSAGKPIVSLNAEFPASSITVKTTVPSPTFSTGTVIFDRSDFYISPDSAGLPIVSLAAEDVDTTSVLVKTTDLGGTFTPPNFNTNKITFNRSHFYIEPDSQGKPIINLAQNPTTSSSGDTSVVAGVQSQDFSSSVEWQFQHNLNSRPLLWGIYDTGFSAILPDKLDISNPNTAYFYFVEPTAGTAIVSSGRVSADINVRDNYDSFSNVRTVTFHSDDFYVTQNSANEAIVNSKEVTRVIVGDNSGKSYVTNKIGFNKESFYLTGDSGNNPVVNAKEKSFCVAGLTVFAAPTDIAVNDHIQFTTAYVRGSNIKANTTSPYTTSTGASLGRFTLQPGRTYFCDAVVRFGFTAATAGVNYYWTNDSGTDLLTLDGTIAPFSQAALIPTTYGLTNSTSQHHCVAIFTPTVETIIEVRIIVSTSVLHYTWESHATIQEL